MYGGAGGNGFVRLTVSIEADTRQCDEAYKELDLMLARMGAQ